MSVFSPPHSQLGLGSSGALARGGRARDRGSWWKGLQRLASDQRTLRVATIAFLVVLVAGLLVEVPGLAGVAHRIEHIRVAWIALAIALELASAISFVVLFRLFFDRLDGRNGRALAWTSQGSGALLPGGGAGGLAIGAALTRLAGAPTRWIVRRSAGLFFLSAGVSSLALIGSGIALLAGAGGPHDFLRVVVPTSVAAIGTLSIAMLPTLLGSGSRGPRWLRVLADGVREAEHELFTRRPSWRLLGAIGYLGFDVAVLWVMLRALGNAPSVAVVTLAYSVGYVANSLPVPGGIGVLDAGLTAALVLYGVSPVHAAAAVIVYHAIAFWLPGLGGLIAYLRLRPRLLRPNTNAAATVGATTLTSLEGGTR
jgi:uncharacterized membrane protein YbhN (UPF0104 family)